jgi:hypothetical protein
MSSITLSEAQADLVYGMLTQRLYMRENDPERETLIEARDAIRSATSGEREAQEAANLLAQHRLGAESVTWQMETRIDPDVPNPIIGTRPGPGGGLARLYQDGMVDAVDGDLYVLSLGFESFADLEAWHHEETEQARQAEAERAVADGDAAEFMAASLDGQEETDEQTERRLERDAKTLSLGTLKNPGTPAREGYVVRVEVTYQEDEGSAEHAGYFTVVLPDSYHPNVAGDLAAAELRRRYPAAVYVSVDEILSPERQS